MKTQPNLKLNIKDQNVFFTSDWHYNHSHFSDDVNGERITPIWKMRGYKSCQEMNEDIIETTNRLVGENDILIHHGDMALRTDLGELRSLLSRIKCQNIMYLWGNHESPTLRLYREELNEGISKDSFLYPFTYQNVTFLGTDITVQIRVNGIGVYNFQCSHFPKSIWDKCSSGFIHTCGHSHMGFDDTHPDIVDNGKAIDVGWDYLKSPLSFNEIIRIANKKKYVKKGRH